MLIRNKTYISLLFAGSNWAGIILRPVGGDPRVMLVMSCKKKLGSSATDFNVALQRMQKKVQPQELYVRTAWTTMENHKKFVHCPLSPSFFFPDFNVLGPGNRPSLASECRPAPRPRSVADQLLGQMGGRENNRGTGWCINNTLIYIYIYVCVCVK